MTQILRFAITPVESRKYPQDLGRALRRERRIDHGELRNIEAGIGYGASAHIPSHQIELERLWHVDAGVLEQGREVVGGRAEQRVLKIDEAETPKAAAFRKPDQIG